VFYDHFVRETFGKKLLVDIKYLDVLHFKQRIRKQVRCFLQQNSSSFCLLEEKPGKIAANADFTGLFKEICSVECCTILRKNMEFKKRLVTRLVT